MDPGRRSVGTEAEDEAEEEAAAAAVAALCPGGGVEVRLMGQQAAAGWGVWLPRVSASESCSSVWLGEVPPSLVGARCLGVVTAEEREAAGLRRGGVARMLLLLLLLLPPPPPPAIPPPPSFLSL